MKMLFRVAALAAAVLVASAPALADIQVKDATGATIATCSTAVSSTQVPCHQVKNAAGTTINPATSDKQPALGTAGAPSADVITVQGAPGGQPQPVDTVIRSTATDRGASVTTAGTAQQLMAVNTARRGFNIQNQSSGACYISGTGTATQDYHSLLIAAGSFYESKDSHVGTGAISIICAVASASVYSREW
ncbi:hypothetical protein [Sphingomonas nostoxanthinifaciens]|uniref:hypothetical protein n=1 Tax=Sphingomonas nostoxanthinifaciens TaxID=2872652 RepID=UPI001CC1F498|nr:hypothetical protein [Sphingomonas nostoxanthinifaciens]UAK23683.1 hypothetical protein K8P63_15025 [Sphingomonas nostoxanthinifaciens]